MQKNKIELRSKVTITLSLLVVGYLLYFYPIQKYLAEKSFDKYVAVQGVNKDNIKSKRILKDYTQDGYLIDVVYKDDDDYMYQYKYFVGKNSFKYSIYCIVYKENVSIDVTGYKIKYPPLE